MLLFQYTDGIEAQDLGNLGVSVLRAMYVFEVFSWKSVSEPQSWEWSSVLDSFQKIVILEEILRSHYQSDFDLARANSGVAFLRHFMNHTLEVQDSSELSLAVDTFTFEMQNSLFAFNSKKMMALKDTISTARCDSDANVIMTFVQDKEEY